MMNYVYDIETFPNCFLLTVESVSAPFFWQFEISERVNQSSEIIGFMLERRRLGDHMVGFNNINFDYPVLHTLLLMGRAESVQLYNKAQSIINSQDDISRWTHRIHPSEEWVRQIDLYLIHHFDNRARATSLKTLEFNMCSDLVQELPFSAGTQLTPGQMDTLKEYNLHDVRQTKKFYSHTLPMIDFRNELSKEYGRDFTNYNDTKIGKSYFIMELEKAGVQCYTSSPTGRKPIQTKRQSIELKDAILPSTRFSNSHFNKIRSKLWDQTIYETKGVFKDLSCKVDDIEYVFGLGGLHASVENKIIESDDEFTIVDFDVSSYYPNLAIVNKFYPAHLGSKFYEIYKTLYERRKSYPKGTAQNAMLKLALNGVFGDSNNPYSPFYDPLFTMQITINGQLLLLMLVEKVLEVSEIIQVNTDGITVKVKKNSYDFLKLRTGNWEKYTGLTLEENKYSKMFIRDVNNYIAVYENGSVKRKGAYSYNMEWHQDHSAIVVAKVAEKVLLEGVPIRETVMNWSDKMDFMIRIKVPRSSFLSATLLDGQEYQLPNFCRYYVCHNGVYLTKYMPPLKGKTEWRKFEGEKGWTVCVCNDIKDATLPINYEYYIQEVEKLCLILQ